MKTIYVVLLKDYNFSDYQKISIASQLPATEFCDVCIVSSIKFQPLEKENLQKMTAGSDLIDKKISFTYFDDEFFASLDGYNKLLKSQAFYHRFAEYEFMIISQADVYLLQPQMLSKLNSFMSGYDYLGAPWFFFVHDTPSLVHTDLWSRKYFRSVRKLKDKLISLPQWLLFKLKLQKKPFYIDHIMSAGNGGFSIRRVSSFLKYFQLATTKEIKDAEKFIEGADLSVESNIKAEDIFWTLLVPKVFHDFKIAKPSDAIFICWESGDPKTLLRLTRGQYPCAIHAWWKWQLKEFVLKFHSGKNKNTAKGSKGMLPAKTLLTL